MKKTKTYNYVILFDICKQFRGLAINNWKIKPQLLITPCSAAVFILSISSFYVNVIPIGITFKY